MSGGPSVGERIALLALRLEVAALVDDLAWWEPVGSLREALSLATRGEGGLSSVEVSRLRSWSSRWLLVAPGLRSLLRRAGDLVEPPDAVFRSLWRIVAHPERVVSDHDRRVLRSLHRDLFGFEPPFDLSPDLAISSRVPCRS
jgi:hypothetical protein